MNVRNVTPSVEETPHPHADVPPAAVREALPRCPYAAHAVGRGAMRSCPGFVAGRLGVVDIEPWEVEVGDTAPPTCTHLGVQESEHGGFTSACLLPGGPPAGAQTTAAGAPPPRA